MKERTLEDVENAYKEAMRRVQDGTKAKFHVTDDGRWQMRLSGVSPQNPEFRKVLADWFGRGIFVEVVPVAVDEVEFHGDGESSVGEGLDTTKTDGGTSNEGASG
jgi:hypothetical protein